MIREMLTLDLRDAGVQVLTAEDGEEAIAMLETARPDMVLLDILMPKKDGFAVLQHLRSAGADMPVVMLTNLGSPEQEDACRKLGVRDFLVKSELDTGDLWERIRKHL
jgi:two-component system OmpR family response regulator